jgi:AraC-like DNA-binding protein
LRAAPALREGESDLSTLALDLGFSHHGHFTSVFRRLVGVPPSKVWGRLGCRKIGLRLSPPTNFEVSDALRQQA